MRAEQLIIELETFGYNFYLDGENIRYKFHALVEPPKERIEILLDSLRRNKPEVISYLRANERPNKPLSPHGTGVSLHKMPLSEFEKAGKVLKVWSEVLKEHVYFVSFDAVLNRNPLDLVAYTAQELTAMLGMPPEELKAIHEVKTIFHKGRVIAHERDAA